MRRVNILSFLPPLNRQFASALPSVFQVDPCLSPWTEFGESHIATMQKIIPDLVHLARSIRPFNIRQRCQATGHYVRLPQFTPYSCRIFPAFWADRLSPLKFSWSAST